MKHFLQLTALMVGLAGSATAQTPAPSQDWRQQFRQITFGVASGENQQEGNVRWAPMAPYLQRCLGIERVTIRVSNDYSAMIEAMVQGDVHLAFQDEGERDGREGGDDGQDAEEGVKLLVHGVG